MAETPTEQAHSQKITAKGLFLGLVKISLFLFGLFILINMGLALVRVNLDSSPRAKVSRILNDLRTMRTAIEAYKVDNREYPPMTWNTPAKPFGKDATVFYGTLLMDGPGSISTPITYISVLPAMPQFDSSSDSPRHLGWLYLYGNLKQYRQILAEGSIKNFKGRLPYAPTTPAQLDAFEREFGDYVLWSQGTQGWEEFRKNNTPVFLPYDPTNGTYSAGAVFVSQKFYAPQWVDAEALEP
jgi:hypothetical protein